VSRAFSLSTRVGGRACGASLTTCRPGLYRSNVSLPSILPFFFFYPVFVNARMRRCTLLHILPPRPTTFLRHYRRASTSPRRHAACRLRTFALVFGALVRATLGQDGRARPLPCLCRTAATVAETHAPPLPAATTARTCATGAARHCWGWCGRRARILRARTDICLHRQPRQLLPSGAAAPRARVAEEGLCPCCCGLSPLGRRFCCCFAPRARRLTQHLNIRWLSLFAAWCRWRRRGKVEQQCAHERRTNIAATCRT